MELAHGDLIPEPLPGDSGRFPRERIEMSDMGEGEGFFDNLGSLFSGGSPPKEERKKRPRAASEGLTERESK